MYKQLWYTGRDVWPAGPDAFRTRLRAGFAEHAHLQAPEDIRRAILQGKWWLKELEAIGALRKYVNHGANHRYVTHSLVMIVPMLLQVSLATSAICCTRPGGHV
jgi:hypothetical protein